MRLSYSITANGITSCSGGCTYCSAGSAMHYTMTRTNLEHLQDKLYEIDRKTYEEEYRADYAALANTLDNDLTNIKKAEYHKNARIHFDIWGGDPVASFTYLQDITEFLKDFCQERGFIPDIHTSTNGLALMRDDIYDWLKANNIHVQLSHDALGQSDRTGEIDPVYDIPNVKRAIRDGIIDWINTTVTAKNWSMKANRQYWIDVLKDIFPAVFDDTALCTKEEDTIYRRLQIKLNHIYDGTTNNYSFTGDVLNNYIHEWYDMYFYLATHNTDNNPYWLPFRSYIQSQMKRWRPLTPDAQGRYRSGSCQQFQSGISDTTFVIDTLGKYSQCNLIDSDHKVLNPTAATPDYCKDCKYNNQQECNKCGSVGFPEKCEYQIAWIRFLENVHRMDYLINMMRGKNGNNSNNCTRKR